jgi:hypothetical protein
MKKPDKPSLAVKPPRKAGDRFWWLITVPILALTDLLAYLIYFLLIGIWIVANRVPPAMSEVLHDLFSGSNRHFSLCHFAAPGRSTLSLRNLHCGTRNRLGVPDYDCCDGVCV